MSEIIEKFEPLFNPRSITFIGASASPEKWGSIILSHIITGHFRGKVYPINPREKEILGLRTYPDVEALPEPTDLAIFVIPSSHILSVLEDCARKGVKAGIIITAGFAEVGAEGEKLQQEIVRIAREREMILVGPNCFGIISTTCSLSTTMPPLYPKPGPFAIVSQSGNVAVSLAHKLIDKDFGISRLISYGNEADLHCEDYLEYLAEDAETKVILSYAEGFKDGRRFFEIAKKVTRRKPIVMLKVGYTAAGARAARSHTSALTGSDATFNAACKQTGIIRARNMDEMVDIGVALLNQPLPKGKSVGILTGGGGLGVLAADACAYAGLNVAHLPEETIEELNTILPPWWNHDNPVDLAAGAFGMDAVKAIEALLRCNSIDGMVLLNLMVALPINIGVLFRDDLASGSVPQEKLKAFEDGMGQLFNQLVALVAKHGKPIIIATELESENIDVKAKKMAGQKGLAYYTQPDRAALVFSRLAQYAEYLRNLSPCSPSAPEPDYQRRNPHPAKDAKPDERSG